MKFSNFLLVVNTTCSGGLLSEENKAFTLEVLNTIIVKCNRIVVRIDAIG